VPNPVLADQAMISVAEGGGDVEAPRINEQLYWLEE
jgi:hypothetical protein